MASRRKALSERSRSPEAVIGNVHEWIMSLPWVVERPDGVGAPGVRTFAVDCEPLDLRQLWLITGLSGQKATRALGAAVIVPAELADDFAAVGLARTIAPMPAGQVLSRIPDDADRDGIEIVIVEAYASAMS